MASVSIIEFEKALISLEEALNFSEKSKDNEQTFKIARDACIQRFEFCVELSWKISKKVLGSTGTTAKPVLREMLQNGLIFKIDLWFDFLESRNKSSHTYDDAIAETVFNIIKLFLPEGKTLLEKLKSE